RPPCPPLFPYTTLFRSRPEAVAPVVGCRPLPQRDADGTDQGEGQDQQGPFAGLSLRGGDRHDAVRLSPEEIGKAAVVARHPDTLDRKSTRLNSSHSQNS